jgi:hypothetical protein
VVGAAIVVSGGDHRPPSTPTRCLVAGDDVVLYLFVFLFTVHGIRPSAAAGKTGTHIWRCVRSFVCFSSSWRNVVLVPYSLSSSRNFRIHVSSLLRSVQKTLRGRSSDGGGLIAVYVDQKRRRNSASY